jgi:2-methylisocitrate lyase-like PEP mutase family enzyme
MSPITELLATSRPRVLPGTWPLVANTIEHGKTPLRTAAELHADGITTRAAERMLGFAEMDAVLGVEERSRREQEWLE